MVGCVVNATYVMARLSNRQTAVREVYYTIPVNWYIHWDLAWKKTVSYHARFVFIRVCSSVCLFTGGSPCDR